MEAGPSTMRRALLPLLTALLVLSPGPSEAAGADERALTAELTWSPGPAARRAPVRVPLRFDPRAGVDVPPGIVDGRFGRVPLAALGSEDAPTDLALSLDYRISHLLVDEFQDTSRSQYNRRPLRSEQRHGRRTNSARGTRYYGNSVLEHSRCVVGLLSNEAIRECLSDPRLKRQ